MHRSASAHLHICGTLVTPPSSSSLRHTKVPYGRRSLNPARQVARSCRDRRPITQHHLTVPTTTLLYRSSNSQPSPRRSRTSLPLNNTRRPLLTPPLLLLGHLPEATRCRPRPPWASYSSRRLSATLYISPATSRPRALRVRRTPRSRTRPRHPVDQPRPTPTAPLQAASAKPCTSRHTRLAAMEESTLA